MKTNTHGGNLKVSPRESALKWGCVFYRLKNCTKPKTLLEILNRAEYDGDLAPADELRQITHDLRARLERGKQFNEPFKLYRYSAADYFNIRNLEVGQLYLSPIGKMNDVYDGIPSDKLSRLTEEEWGQLSDMAYIKCFSEAPTNLLMWAHYADKHAGFCVEYDLTLLDERDKIIDFLFPVAYIEHLRYGNVDLKELAEELRLLNEGIRGNEQLYESFNPDWITSLFITKGSDWVYENEWRIVIPKFDMYTGHLNRGSDNIFEDKIIPFDCASAVYFGRRTPQNIKSHIQEIVSRQNEKRTAENPPQIKVFQIQLHATEYKLVYYELK